MVKKVAPHISVFTSGMKFVCLALILSVYSVNVEGQTFQQLLLFASPSRFYRQNLAPVTQSTVLKAKGLVRWLVDNRKENGTRTFNPGFVRLAFHDCVGRCNGCVNLANPGHKGLAFYKFPLDLMYHSYIYPDMSRADFYALAGITAAEYASELSPTGDVLQMEFKWGRQTCFDERLELKTMPDVDEDGKAFLSKEFKMNLSMSVALQGAHSMGRDHTVSEGQWVDNVEALDNAFYKDLLNGSLNWTMGIKGGEARQFAFSHGETSSHQMFSADMFAAYDMRYRNESRCQRNPEIACPLSSTYEDVVAYANDNRLWLNSFAEAYGKLLSHGYGNRLKSVIMDTNATEHNGPLFPPGQNPDGEATTKPTTDSTEDPSDRVPTSGQQSSEQATTANGGTPASRSQVTSTTKEPTDATPSIRPPTTPVPFSEPTTTKSPTTAARFTEPPTTQAPSTEPPSTQAPSTEPPTPPAPSTRIPSTSSPITEKTSVEVLDVTTVIEQTSTDLQTPEIQAVSTTLRKPTTARPTTLGILRSTFKLEGLQLGECCTEEPPTGKPITSTTTDTAPTSQPSDNRVGASASTEQQGSILSLNECCTDEDTIQTRHQESTTPPTLIVVAGGEVGVNSETDPEAPAGEATTSETDVDRTTSLVTSGGVDTSSNVPKTTERVTVDGGEPYKPAPLILLLDDTPSEKNMFTEENWKRFYELQKKHGRQGTPDRPTHPDDQ